MKILLIGAGNMGGAMLQGLQAYDVTIVEANPKRQEELKQLYQHLKLVSQIPKLEGYIVILAIKPQTFPKITFNGVAQGVISIMAGISLEQLRQHIQAKSYIRSMPNMAALVQKSATAVCGDETLKSQAMEILSSIGSTFWLESENELDIATALVGSSPAWMSMVAESLSDGAVKCGLKRDVSYQFVAALFEGMGELLRHEHPALIKDKVMSPSGTTAVGYASLEASKIRDAFIKAIEQTYNKAQSI